MLFDASFLKNKKKYERHVYIEIFKRLDTYTWFAIFNKFLIFNKLYIR